MEFDLPTEISSIIKVIGVGGGGSNAVNHMYNLGIKGVDFIVCNTDKQALDISPVPLKIQLGLSLTEGRGAGALPEIGKNAAIENIEEIRDYLSKGTKMVFVTAGMGGGTGTGAAPVIAQVAKELGILTVGIVTVPFSFEGRKRRQQAENGLEEMRKSVDTLLIINNERLREVTGNLTISNAFSQADSVLSTAAKGIAEVISVTGAINVDFNDVNTVMKDSGVAIMGSAASSGENRAIESVTQALNSPLLNDNNIEGARYVLLNITYGDIEVLMDEITVITDFIQDEAGSTADVIWGHAYDPSLGDKLSVTVIATGFKTSPITGFEKAPEKVVQTLEVETKKEIVSPMNNPLTTTVEVSQKVEIIEKNIVEEPYLKSTQGEVINPVPFQKNVEEKTQQIIEEKESRVIDWEIETKPENVIVEQKKVEENASSQVNYLNLYEDEERSAREKSTVRNQVSSEEQQRMTQERMERIREYTNRLRKSDGISQLENEPAYVRRNININNEKASTDNNISRLSVSENEQGTFLKNNNSFLHDNVD